MRRRQRSSRCGKPPRPGCSFGCPPNRGSSRRRRLFHCFEAIPIDVEQLVRGNPGFDLGPKRVLITHQPGRVINTGQYLLTADCEPLLARLGYRARVEVLA
jgi:hypothetical protein